MPAVHGSKADVFGNGYVLSPYLNSASPSGERDMADASTFKFDSKKYVPGLKDSTFGLEGVYDGVTDAIDDILWNAFSQVVGTVWSYMPMGHEVHGNPAINFDAYTASYETNSEVGDVTQISAEMNMGDQGLLDRGRVYHPMSAEVAGGNTASIDNGAATTSGGALTAHITASSTLVVKLQDSADNSVWADIATLSISSTTGRKSQRIITPVTATIRRYTRVLWTGTGTFCAIGSRL